MPVRPALAVVAGTASGFTTFVAHAGGPPVAMYLLARGVPKTVFAGTNVAFFILANVLKLPSYVALGWNRPGSVPRSSGNAGGGPESQKSSHCCASGDSSVNPSASERSCTQAST